MLLYRMLSEKSDCRVVSVDFKKISDFLQDNLLTHCLIYNIRTSALLFSFADNLFDMFNEYSHSSRKEISF